MVKGWKVLWRRDGKSISKRFWTEGESRTFHRYLGPIAQAEIWFLDHRLGWKRVA